MSFPTPAQLLPHAPPMVLLDAVIAYTPPSIEACLTLREGIAFYVAGRGIPAQVGLEYMAQTCGLYAGLEAQQRGLPIRMGFLLGTRRYRAETAWFAPGATLHITAQEIMRQDGLGVFDCQIHHGGEPIAKAQLTVYSPPDEQSPFTP